MQYQHFQKQFDAFKEQINHYLIKYLDAQMSMSPDIYEAMRYSLLAGGKRLRPVLCVAVYELLKRGITSILPVACALEYIHTYSLVHDDLPCMDNDDFRRGVPTCHKKFGEAYAVLAGDCLLTEAFGLISQWQDSAEMAILIKELVNASGGKGLIAGQLMDILSENQDVSCDTLEYIHEHKTGKLIVASVRLGAICGKATPKELEKLTSFAKSLGLAFQIQDDILDVVGSKELLGKNVGQDTKLHKATFPALYGLDRSRQKLADAIDHAISKLEYFGERSRFLQDLTRFVANRAE